MQSGALKSKSQLSQCWEQVVLFETQGSSITSSSSSSVNDLLTALVGQAGNGSGCVKQQLLVTAGQNRQQRPHQTSIAETFADHSWGIRHAGKSVSNNGTEWTEGWGGLTLLGQFWHQSDRQPGQRPPVPQGQGQNGQDPAHHHLLSSTLVWTQVE